MSKRVILTEQAYDILLSLVEEKMNDLGPDDSEYEAYDAVASELDTAEEAA